MSCKTYERYPKVYDQELKQTNDIEFLDSIITANKKIRYVLPSKI